MRLLIVLVLATVAPAAVAAAAPTLGTDTTQQRVVGGDRSAGFSFLSLTEGQPRVVREDLVPAQAGREERRRSVAYFAQLSDFQLADEESPARVEFTDRLNALFSAAWRPHEALMPHTVDASVRQVNSFGRSPHEARRGRRARMAFAITTGDNADNQQRNEVEWVAQLLDGGRIDPNSGTSDPAAYSECAPGNPGPEEAPLYTGVQDRDDYAESGLYYDPDQPDGPFATWPAYPGLMDRAQQPFDTVGLDVPSYVSVGNHDLLVQGNQWANSVFEDLVTGCTKVMGPTLAAGSDMLDGLTAATFTSSPENTVEVPPDPKRSFVTAPEYRELFAAGQTDAHGFAFVDTDVAEASKGAANYYDFEPLPGVRMIALDTVANGGIAGVASDGNVDDPQFLWLERQLEEATARGELVILFSHHGPTSLTADVTDEAAPQCQDRDNPRDDPNPGCDLDPRDSGPIRLEEDLVGLVARFPAVVAWVAGHSHVNDVKPYPGADGNPGFWVIRTSAEADWPHQDRLIEVMDNRDGTLSLFGTLIDNAAPVEAAAPGTDAAALGVDALAAIGRTLGYNDPDDNGGGVGEADDANVELLVRDPRPARPAGGAKQAELRVKVRPRRIRIAKRTVLKIRVRRSGKPVRGVRVKAFGKSRRTGRRGRTRIAVRPRRPGIRSVRVRGARASVIVRRR